jgi:hypothetical protein
MAPGDDYRVKAAAMNVRAKQEKNLLIRAEFENLALAYLRLADQAERNAKADLVYETPTHPAAQPQQQQQQQQPQPKKPPDQ